MNRQERISQLHGRQLERVRNLRNRLTLMFIGGRNPSRSEMVEVERLRDMFMNAEVRERKLFLNTLPC